MHHSVQRSVFGERNFNVYSSTYQENSSTKVRSIDHQSDQSAAYLKNYRIGCSVRLNTAPECYGTKRLGVDY